MTRFHRVRPVLLLALVPASIGLLAMLTFVAAGESPAAIEFRSPPALDKVQADTAHLEGNKALIVEPTISGPAQVRMQGPYRLIDAGFTGTLAAHQEFAVPERGDRSQDAALLTRSPLFLPIAEEIPEWTMVGMHTGDGDSNTVLQQVFRNSAGDVLRITRIYRAFFPIDIPAPRTGLGATLRLELTNVKDLPAIALTRTPASLIPRAYTYLSFVDGPIETVIDGDGFNFAQALDLAVSIHSLSTAAELQQEEHQK